MVFEDIIQPAVAIFSTFPGWLKFACFLGVAIVSLSAIGFVLDLAQVPHTLFQTCTYTTVSDNTRIALYQFAGYEKASRTADIPLFGNTTVDNPCLPCITPRVVIGTEFLQNLLGVPAGLVVAFPGVHGVADSRQPQAVHRLA